jgi:hypothetical protein
MSSPGAAALALRPCAAALPAAWRALLHRTAPHRTAPPLLHHRCWSRPASSYQRWAAAGELLGRQLGRGSDLLPDRCAQVTDQRCSPALLAPCRARAPSAADPSPCRLAGWPGALRSHWPPGMLWAAAIAFGCARADRRPHTGRAACGARQGGWHVGSGQQHVCERGGWMAGRVKVPPYAQAWLVSCWRVC